jgi:methylamine dehydrogenase accessory protein MauD
MTTSFYLSYAALWLLVVFLSLVVLGLVRNVYRLQSAAAGGAVAARNGALPGRPAPEFSTVDLAGNPIRTGDFAGRLTALLFVGPDCGTCELTLDDLNALNVKAKQSVVVICQGDRDECARLADAYRLDAPVVVDRDVEISELFGIATVPTAVLIAEDGQIASYGHPLGRQELEELIATARSDADGQAPDPDNTPALEVQRMP